MLRQVAQEKIGEEMKFKLTDSEPTREKITELKLMHASCGQDVLLAARAAGEVNWQYLVRFHTNGTVGFHMNDQEVGERLGVNLNDDGQIAVPLSHGP